jgi:CheY-like chemotaxis protein
LRSSLLALERTQIQARAVGKERAWCAATRRGLPSLKKLLARADGVGLRPTSRTMRQRWGPNEMPLASPALLIVSSDWFARELLRNMTGASGEFGSITAVEDGYEALVEIWQRAIDRQTLPSILVDLHQADDSALRLSNSLRSDPETCHLFIAFLMPPAVQVDVAGIALPDADFVSSCSAASDDLPGVLAEMARQIRDRIAPPSALFGSR